MRYRPSADLRAIVLMSTKAMIARYYTSFEKKKKKCFTKPLLLNPVRLAQLSARIYPRFLRVE